MTDHPPDTPKSLRALAEELCALSATPDLRLTQVAAALDVAEDALRRAADRLEAADDSKTIPESDAATTHYDPDLPPGEYIVIVDTLGGAASVNGPVAASDALDAARRAGAEEMRAAAAEAVRTCLPAGKLIDGQFWTGPLALPNLVAAILALPLPGDQP